MKRGIFFGTVCFLVFLLVIRVLGERQFAVKPEVVPAVQVNTQTPLYQSVRAILERAESPAVSMFYPLGDPHIALISRIQLADNASERIDVQYYLFHDDAAGRALLAAVIAAAKRGVKVRLLLDDMDVPGREGLFARLAAEQENIAIRVFNPVWLRSLRGVEYLARFPRVTRRMHNKSYTVDSISSVVGGRNIGNEYFDIQTEVAFTDFDIMASGAVAAEVSEAFNIYWYSGIAVDIASLNEAGSPDEAYSHWLAQLEQALQVYREKTVKFEEQITQRIMDRTLRPYYDRGSVIYDRPEKVLSRLSDTNGHLAPQIMELMGSAKQKLLIASPYFIPGKRGMKLFRELRERGVEVIILTNSLAANDVAAVHSGYRDYRRELVAAGVQLFELKAINRDRQLSLLGSKNASLHAKSFVIDQQRIYVGSFNLDPRSAIHNTEMGVVFASQEYARGVYARLRPYLDKHAYQVRLNAEGELEWLENDASGNALIHHHEPDTVWWQRVVVYLISWLPVEWLL